MSIIKNFYKFILLAVLWASPIVVGQLPSSISFGGDVQAAQDKKKTRKVPAMREKTYKKLAEAQLMIDPDSIPREEGEEAPTPKGTPRDAIQMLLELREAKGLNSYELAQIWNTLAHLNCIHYTGPHTKWLTSQHHDH